MGTAVVDKELLLGPSNRVVHGLLFARYPLAKPRTDEVHDFSCLGEALFLWHGTSVCSPPREKHLQMVTVTYHPPTGHQLRKPSRGDLL